MIQSGDNDTKELKTLPLDGGIVKTKGVKKSTVDIYELRERVIHAIKHYKNDKNEVIGIEGIIQQASPNEVLKFLGRILPKDISVEKTDKRIVINLNANMKDI